MNTSLFQHNRVIKKLDLNKDHKLYLLNSYHTDKEMTTFRLFVCLEI